MLTTEPTPEMIEEWKQIYKARQGTIKPNRKTGAEVDCYFREHYSYCPLSNQDFHDMIAAGILENGYKAEKLSKGTLPDVQCYTAEGLMVGIDRNSGEFHIEGEDLNKVIAMHDDLFIYRGLDENDLKNFFLTAEYVKLTEIKPKGE
ncbi:MAG: hypothetical protein MJ075_05955 [Oscillospiraceae bacterium]|nr:hypothetical protein [Oscillospiraceae bacterium]